jgi:signal peptidase I
MDEARPTVITAPAHQSGSVKETIESILVAFVLAFIFRAFVVEAFVIPTGSMAPTLMGAHMRFQCPDCGYRFDVNYTGANSNDSDDINIPANAGPISQPVYCPNCGFRMDSAQVGNPPVYSGDRILVLKYLYLFQQAKRWDVVVFKAPVRPLQFNYGQNYIKRLIGKPGEAVMILDGDVYIRAADAKDPTDFVIQTKPKAAQDALWRLVYDNDFRPQMMLDRGDAPAWKMPWAVDGDGSGWALDDPATHGRNLKFDNAAGSATLQFNPGANPTAQTLSDYLVYDVLPRAQISKSPMDSYPNPNETPVSDLDLRATYQRLTGEGPLSLQLTKRQDVFTAVVTATQASLFHESAGKRTQIGESFPLSKSGPIRLELSNADYQVTLRVDDQIAAQTTGSEYAPDMPQLLNEYRERQAQRDNRDRVPPPHVRIIADHQTCQLSHVSLWRDVYYYNSNPPVSEIRWATPRDFPNHVQQLGPDEYFVMGDNSLVSYDARCWDDPINLPGENLIAGMGRVPGRFLLGKAFFVYWPAGFRPIGNWPPIVPNFGDMRFIH